ncbi:MAG: TVP38/TMEM64 family protein [Phycisphaerae bacterium]|nr:TVP38/TMEM64 family protein [Phycisphaerae bacterium]
MNEGSRPTEERSRSTESGASESFNASGPWDARKVIALLRHLGPAGVLAVISATLPALGGFVLLGSLSWTGNWLRGQGDQGVFIYVVGYSLLAGLALLPTYAQSITGGFCFGRFTGSLAALGGILGAATLAYVIARRASGERVVRLIEEQPKWKAVYTALVGGGFWKTLLIVALLRVPPNSPFAITNLVMAATKVSWPVYALGTVVGIAPRTVFAVYVGAQVTELSTGSFSSTGQWLITLVVGLVVLAIIGAIANRALRTVTTGSCPERSDRR